MQLSILLPTVRPEQITPCLEALRRSAAGLQYEIIVVADFPPPQILPEEVRWHLQRERHGPIQAIAKAQSHAVGDYLFLLSDEDRMIGSLEKLYRMAEISRLKGEKVIFCPWCGGQWFYFGETFPPFPFVHREILALIGGQLLDPTFGAHYADPDLGMRAFEAGIEIRMRPSIPIQHDNYNDASHVENVNRFFLKDEEQFHRKWAHLRQKTGKTMDNLDMRLGSGL